jgi:serine/threonine-protein kinase
LQGDLDTIILKALQKNPRQRYATADAFAQDIERHRKGEPVLAQPESAWYRSRKFVQRNQLAVASVAAVVVGLSVGLGIALWQGHVARVEKQRADFQAATAKAVNDFLQNDLLAPGQCQYAGATGHQARSGSEGAHSLGPGGGPDHRKVRPATGS